MENWKKLLTDRVIELNEIRRDRSPFVLKSTQFEYLIVRYILEFSETHTYEDCVNKLKEQLNNQNTGWFEKEKIKTILFDMENTNKTWVNQLQQQIEKISQSRRYF